MYLLFNFLYVYKPLDAYGIICPFLVFRGGWILGSFGNSFCRVTLFTIMFLDLAVMLTKIHDVVFLFTWWIDLKCKIAYYKDTRVNPIDIQLIYLP